MLGVLVTLNAKLLLATSNKHLTIGFNLFAVTIDHESLIGCNVRVIKILDNEEISLDKLCSKCLDALVLIYGDLPVAPKQKMID